MTDLEGVPGGGGRSESLKARVVLSQLGLNANRIKLRYLSVLGPRVVFRVSA